MTGLVTEVKRKSPSMVHRWVSVSSESREQRAEAETGPVKDRGPVDLERIEEQVELSAAAGLRSTIKSKLHLNEWYDKISKTRDITGLFQRTTTPKRMEQQSEMMTNQEDKHIHDGDASEGRRELGVDASDLQRDEIVSSDEDVEIEGLGYEVDGNLPRSQISEGVNHKLLGNASSPKQSRDEEFQFSFEDFSFIEGKTPAKERVLPTIESQRELEEDSGCVVKGQEESVVTTKPVATKPRRLNIGEIGRSASASQQHPDSGIDLGTMGGGGGVVGGTKRHLLSDIGRRFSEMNESSDCCEFRSDSLQKDHSSHFRPNSMPVSPKPRMIMPAQHRGSTDFTNSVGKQRGNSLFREYSMQVC